MQAEHVAMASAAFIISGMAIGMVTSRLKPSPLLLLQRGIIYTRAAGKVLRYAGRAAWAERRRWHASVEEARRET
jgi:hypothetical protein